MTTILVVEDDTEYRSMLRDMLELARYMVIEADDGDVGLRLYRQKTPDLTITDLFMPNKDGIELIVALRSEFPDAKIIAISNGGRAEPGVFLSMAKDLGAMYTLRKPFEREKLLVIIEECLSDALDLRNLKKNDR